MPLNIEKFTEDFAAEWDHYVANADNGTMFHTRRFLSYHPHGRFKDHSLIFRRGNKISALFPATDVQLDKERTLISHRGSSYGGFVYRDMGIRDAFQLVEALTGHARDAGFNKIWITLPPLVYMRRYSNYIDFALTRNGFRYLKREISSVLQLPSSTAEIFSAFKPEARTATRKSLKSGIEIRRSDEYDAYYDILQHNLKMRHNVSPTHTLPELKKLARLFPEKIHLWGAYLDGRMIAGVVNFICNEQTVLAFYIADDKRYQQYRSVNNLFYHIFQWAVENGYRFYDFGIFTVNMAPNWGLGKFKESFGARGLFRDTFEILL
ncbi:MAG: GNAT family N-acetyltransferase [Calditrichaeota bacterium]|nr:MAG: GNAT family N-acetyltransferase [Calditrichota bacterium]